MKITQLPEGNGWPDDARLAVEMMRAAARTAAHMSVALEFAGDAFEGEDGGDMKARLIALYQLAVDELDAATLTAIKRGMPAFNAASFAIQTRRDYEAGMREVNRKALGKGA
jgi:hypothetical protein